MLSALALIALLSNTPSSEFNVIVNSNSSLSITNVIRREDYKYTPNIGGHKFHTLATTWNKARQICQEEGGHLAIINSLAESEAIRYLFSQAGPHVGSNDLNYAFIGFHDFFEQGQYVTVHSNPLEKEGFYTWAKGEPSLSESEDCGSIYIDGTLNDISCVQQYAFVCEVPYVAP